MISRRALFASRLLPALGLTLGGITLAATTANAATTTTKKKKTATKTAKISPKKPSIKS